MLVRGEVLRLPGGHGEPSERAGYNQIAAAVIERLTRPGDRVLDPFAGWGTTLAACEQTGREGWGIEILPERAAEGRSRLAAPERLLVDDARRLAFLALPDDFRLVLTSPPYRTERDHPEDPLTGYRETGGDYDHYLQDLVTIFVAASRRLDMRGQLAIQVDHVFSRNRLTPLPFDLAHALQRKFELVDVIVIAWDEPPSAVSPDHSYVLVLHGHRKGS